MQRTLVIGGDQSASDLERRLRKDPRAGFEVVLSITGPGPRRENLDTWLDHVEEMIPLNEIDAVAITDTTSVTSEAIRRLSWRLEGPSVDLLVAPTLGDATGPRLNVRPAAGLPLLHLEEPRLTGPRALMKRGTDVIVAALGLIFTSPLLLVIALAVRLTSRGPALFVQERVGQGGKTYRLVKFRTMYDGSECAREDALGSLEADPEAYRNDPRITPLGRFLRRWSLDELPQLANVLVGSMSLVGPRPMLVGELPLLGTADHRRHLTKPGMTGLWQVAGRKEVAWSERMQMDLRYVENWSPALDLVILAKTVKAVVSGKGAH
jgi:exopolysaccharide biosynthesis polyprenyl glycosylphosphotransferase